MCLLKRKIFLLLLSSPAAEGHRQEAFEHLSSLGEIVNMKSFSHAEFVGKEVVKQLYLDKDKDNWNQGIEFGSTKSKAELCFDGKGDLQVYVIEANLDESTRIKEKQYLRNLWKKDKHSVHITDTIEEANTVVRMFFNENSRRFMKIERQQEFNSKKMFNMFNEYMDTMPKDTIEKETIAIEGSAVFDLLNIRSGKDIDYITRSKKFNLATTDIERHDENENQYHSDGIDEIITNPKYYFYYKGCKFIDILELLEYKKNRSKIGDEKDINDIKNIELFLQSNPQYGSYAGPRVSIIVPVYNTSVEYLSDCFDSIKSQSYQNTEVIIVDDGSNKETALWLADYVKETTNSKTGNEWLLIQQKNAGLSSARNSGYKIATRQIYTIS
jgi:hypothetical protein